MEDALIAYGKEIPDGASIWDMIDIVQEILFPETYYIFNNGLINDIGFFISGQPGNAVINSGSLQLKSIGIGIGYIYSDRKFNMTKYNKIDIELSGSTNAISVNFCLGTEPMSEDIKSVNIKSSTGTVSVSLADIPTESKKSVYISINIKVNSGNTGTKTITSIVLTQ